MRAVIQRVSHASVTIDGRVKSSIAGGLLVLLGIEEADTLDDAQWLCRKIAGLRIFNDDAGVMNRDILSTGGDVIVVSHDRYFMDKVVDHLLVFKGDGVIDDFPGNYTQYREFAAECEERERAERQAAERLNYTASGVSQLISAMESDFGFLLLKRTTRGVVLTAEGEKMLPAVRAFLSQENRMHELAANINGLDIGLITIAAYSSIATHWLPKVVAAFKKKYPKISPKIIIDIPLHPPKRIGIW